MTPIAIDVEAGQTYWWCRCGRSRQQPWCDGTHKGGDVFPLKYVATETGRIWFCTCKQTSTPPLCDGTHRSMPITPPSEQV
ncbi:MAG: CDGSH iron-sulfur domain-containing protein [Pseudomonadota bacterium]|nr:CDGSH iron-sulfur domain-containing protein [Pseudomonadota bacterium]